MKIFVLSAFFFMLSSVANADSTTLASSIPLSLQNVVEGQACPGPGATGFSSTGLLLSCQSGASGEVWQATSAGLNIIVHVANFGTYSFNAKGGELIMVNANGYASGGHDALVAITVNGFSCGRSQTNGHARAWGVYTNAFCAIPASKGNNTITASGTTSLIIIGS